MKRTLARNAAEARFIASPLQKNARGDCQKAVVAFAFFAGFALNALAGWTSHMTVSESSYFIDTRKPVLAVSGAIAISTCPGGMMLIVR